MKSNVTHTGNSIGPWRAVLISLILLISSTVVGLADETDPNPLEPVDTSSPRATFLAFNHYAEKAYRAWRMREGIAATGAQVRRTLRTLDLAHIGKALLEEVGIADALYLYETLNRINLPPFEAIPDAAMVEAKGLTRWTVPGTEITIAKVTDGERAGEFLFTSDSVARAPQFYDLVKDRPVLHGPDPESVIETWRAAPGLAMPDALAAWVWRLPRWAFTPIAAQPVWKWLAVGLSLLAGVAMARGGWAIGRKLDKTCRRAGVEWRIGQPVAALVALLAVVGLGWFIQSVVVFRERPGIATAIALTAVRYALLAWLVAIVIGWIGGAVVRGFAAGKSSLDAALIRLCFRMLSIVGVLLVILDAASEFGLSVTPIIAGLGVGGLAVALAIRPTLENLVGGFVLFADKPVRVGEFCAFSDKLGTVEEIGLRSTRLRGLDRTVITVPNAEFSQMQIVNFTRRDMNLFQCKIGLRYETTPDQLRYVAAKIRKLLIQHSKVLPDPARVRLGEFGDSAYVLDVFAFIESADWNEFLAVKEDLNFKIAEIVRDSGTGFAFPSQTVYFTRDGGIDTARGATTEAEVQQWRDEKRLPFPEYDFAEKAEMSGTMPFPPVGSPDHEPMVPSEAIKPSLGEGLSHASRWPSFLRRRRPTITRPES